MKETEMYKTFQLVELIINTIKIKTDNILNTDILIKSALLFSYFIVCMAYSATTDKMPELVIQNGHSSWVEGAAFTPDGKILVTCSDDETIKFWIVSTGRLLRTIAISCGSIHDIAISPNGKTLVVGCNDNNIRILDAYTGKIIRTFEGHACGVYKVILSPDGKLLFSGSEDNTIIVWDMLNGNILNIYEASEGYEKFPLAISPDGTRFASTREDSIINIYNIDTDIPYLTLQSDAGYFSTFTFSPDGSRIATGGNNEGIKIWEIESKKLLFTLDDNYENVYNLAYSPNGKLLAASTDYNSIVVWDVNSAKILHNLESHSRNINSLTFTPDGNTLASTSDDMSIILWDVVTGRIIKNLSGHDKIAFDVEFIPNCNMLAIGYSDNTIKFFDMSYGGISNIIESHSRPIRDIELSPYGNRLASASQDNSINVYHTIHCHYRKIWEEYLEYVSEISYSPDNKILASKNYVLNDYKYIKFWDVATNELSHSFKSEMELMGGFTFHPKDNILATGTVYGSIMLWDAPSGQFKGSFKGHDAIYDVAFSPNGKFLASGGYDKTVKLWDYRTRNILHNFIGHSKSVCCVVFAPNNLTLTSGSTDNTIKIWDIESGYLLHTLIGHSSDITTLTYSPDSNILISGSSDNSLRFWRVKDGSLLATTYVFNKTDFITFTPYGYFHSSKQAEKFAAWRIDNNLFNFEYYADQFNNSDYITFALNGEDLPKPQVKTKTNYIPKIFWENKFSSTKHNDIEVIINYEGAYKLEDINCLHNNIPIEGSINYQNKQTEIIIPLHLIEFDNVLNIQVSDVNGSKSEWLRISFIYQNGIKGPSSNIKFQIKNGQQLGEYGKKYAIIIGISDYKFLKRHSSNPDSLIDLQYAHNDAKAFISFLKNPKFSGGGWEIYDFINNQACEQDIDEILTRILTMANQRDLIFIFFSGHARCHPLRPGDVYLLTYDFQPNKPRSGYPYYLLIDLIANTKAEHVIAFIDACRSGTIGFGSRGNKITNLDANEFGQRITQIKENRVIFSSASGIQKSYEHDNIKHGVFTYFLLKGLQGEAMDEKYPNFVDLGELYKFVRLNVFNYTQKHLNKDQLPVLWEKNGTPDEYFPISIRIK